MPSTMVGPALHAPPLLNDHSGLPDLASSAYIVPLTESRLQPKTTPLAPLTAASARLPSGSLVVHSTAPVLRSSAAHPPAVVVLPSFSVHTPGSWAAPLRP